MDPISKVRPDVAEHPVCPSQGMCTPFEQDSSPAVGSKRGEGRTGTWRSTTVPLLPFAADDDDDYDDDAYARRRSGLQQRAPEPCNVMRRVSAALRGSSPTVEVKLTGIISAMVIIHFQRRADCAQ